MLHCLIHNPMIHMDQDRGSWLTPSDTLTFLGFAVNPALPVPHATSGIRGQAKSRIHTPQSEAS